MYRPKALFVETVGNIPSQMWLVKVLTGVKKGTIEVTDKGIWSDDDISILDPEFVELVSGYQKYFVIGTDVVGEVDIDDITLKYAPLTRENFVKGVTVVKTKPDVTKEKLEDMTVKELKAFVNAGSEELKEAVHTSGKKAEIIDEILLFFGKGEENVETVSNAKK